MPKQLPPRPNLEQLRNQAKTILRAHRAGDPETLRQIHEHHPHHAGRFTLADAQFVVARQYNFASWVKLKSHVLQQKPAESAGPLIENLRRAAGRGHLEVLTQILDDHPELIDEPGGSGVRTALHQAVFGNQPAAMKLLLERGANPNIRCEGDNAFPLHFAAEKQNFPLIRLLIEHGGDPGGEGDYHELGVIGWATAWDYVDPNPEIVEYLLAHGGRHNILSAVATGAIDAIREIVARSPADLNRRMDPANKRRFPLHLAVVKNQPASLATLIDLGANLESLDEAFFTALDEAALRGRTELAQTLLDRGAKVRLPAAIALGRTSDVEKLLRRDPAVLRPGNRWGNLIVRAAEIAPGPVIEALLAAGADVNIRDDPKTAVDSTWGYTPLHAAAFRGNRDAVAVLLRHGANVAVREEKYHGTPAGWAYYANHEDVGDLILPGPVDIMEAAEHGLTARIAAILDGDPAALNRPFGEYPLYPLYAEAWHTPLAFAALRGHADTVRFLLDRGATVTPEIEAILAGKDKPEA